MKKRAKKIEVTKDGYAVMKPFQKSTTEDSNDSDVEKMKKDIKQHLNNQTLESKLDITARDFKSIEENKHCGAINNFDRYQSMYEDSKADFKVVSYGVTRKLVYGKYSFIFNGLKGEKKPLGTHLISMLKKDIDKLLKGTLNEATGLFENQVAPLKIPDKKPYLTFVHNKNLDWFGIGQEALAIDINHCYWRTIFLNGRITEATYLKGIAKPEYKDGRLIAVGTLGKILTIKEFKEGIKIKEYIDDTDYLKYGGFFWEVIGKVYALLMDLWHTLKEDFLMFLTDCVVIDPSKTELAKQIIEKHGYGHKEYKIVFTELSENKVAWITDKGEKKYIIHNKKLGNNDNDDNEKAFVGNGNKDS